MSQEKKRLSTKQLLDMIDSMSVRDKKNLEFLLNIDAREYARWCSFASDEDFEYADELLARAANEITLKIHEETIDVVEDVTEANEYLKKFQLKQKRIILWKLIVMLLMKVKSGFVKS